MTKILLKRLKIRPKWVCPAFITHDMIKCDRFWKVLKDRKIAIVGRRAAEASYVFKDRGIDIMYTTGLEGCDEIEEVYKDLSKRKDWEIALLSAGIPATILAPRLAKKTNKVAIDFGHALDMIIDGENFNYEKILRDWEKGLIKRC